MELKLTHKTERMYKVATTSSPFVLRDAGDWTNMQTPGRYLKRSQVVNDGIQLDY